MKRLSFIQTTELLDSINVLNSDISKATLPERVFGAVSRCVKADITALDGFGTDNSYTGRLWYDPMQAVSDEQLAIFAAHTHEHPFFVGMLVDKQTDVMKVSDYLSTEQFHRTGIFNEFYRQVGVSKQMAVALDVSPELLVTCALSRAGRDFNENDRTLLTLLSPHLVAAFRNTQTFDQIESERQYFAGAITCGIVVLDGSGRIKFISELAKELLENYFSDLSSQKLPDVLQRYVCEETARQHDASYYAPASVFTMRAENAELSIRMAFNTSNEITLILEEKLERSPQDFRRIGLTERESEVLFWMGRGKTDAEIAQLCNIGLRTVQKHAENIFVKLGVETRTAAVVTALESLYK